MQIEAGDIVFCRFPCDEGGALPHYGLVIAVQTSAVRAPTYRVAYGSSQKVSESGHLPHEFVLINREEIKKYGLKKPTRFDLRRVTRIADADILDVCGSLDPNDRKVMRRLRDAYNKA